MAAARRRRLSAGIAGLLLALLVALPVAAAPAGPGDARITITSITPVVDGDGTATVRGRVSNTGGETLDGPRVAVVPQEAGSGRSDIAEWAKGDTPVSGTALAATIQPRRLAAEARLRGRFVPVRGFVEALMQDAEGAIGDPARIIALVRKILGLAQTAAQAATLPVLRSELGFIRTLVEDDLGLTPVALGGTVTGFLSEGSRLLAAMPAPPDAAGRRRVRLSRAVLSRLSLRAALLVPPPLDTDPLARLLHRLLTDGGLGVALREVSCAIDGIEASLNAALAAGRAVAETRRAPATHPMPVCTIGWSTPVRSVSAVDSSGGMVMEKAPLGRGVRADRAARG